MSPSIRQLKRKPRKQKKRREKTPALAGSPQRRGVCKKLIYRAPKKPNSAVRKIVLVRLTTGYTVQVYIPGEGHNLQKHSIVLVRGGRTQDVPGVKYKVVRGKFDSIPVGKRKTARSKYGLKKPTLNT
jgi:small subunit ribosomal protein S12